MPRLPTYQESSGKWAFSSGQYISKPKPVTCVDFGQLTTVHDADGREVMVRTLESGTELFKGLRFESSRMADQFLWLAPEFEVAKGYTRGAESNLGVFKYETLRPLILVDLFAPSNVQYILDHASDEQRARLTGPLLRPAEDVGGWNGIQSGRVAGDPDMSQWRDEFSIVGTRREAESQRKHNEFMGYPPDEPGVYAWPDFADEYLSPSYQICGNTFGAKSHLSRNSIKDDIELATVARELFGDVCDGYVHNSSPSLNAEIALFDRTAVRAFDRTFAGGDRKWSSRSGTVTLACSAIALVLCWF